MFLRCHKRKKNGKLHQYYSVVENRRIANGRVSQKTVLYLGEITNDQEKAWRKTLQVFDVDQNKPVYKYLFATEEESICEDIDAICACQPSGTNIHIAGHFAFVNTTKKTDSMPTATWHETEKQLR